MESVDTNTNTMRERLLAEKAELNERLERIKASVRRGADPDSKERATELENVEVVDALGNEIRREIELINNALRRMEEDRFGVCVDCGDAIDSKRLEIQPFVELCFDCAEFTESRAT